MTLKNVLSRGIIWWKSLVIARWFPGIASVTMLGSLLLGAAVATGPVADFVLESQALESHLRSTGPYAAGITIAQSAAPFRTDDDSDDPYMSQSRRTRLLDDALADVAALQPAITTIVGPVVDATVPRAATGAEVRLLDRSGWRQRVEILDSTSFGEIWLSDLSATAAGVETGDRITLSLGDRRRSFRIRGIYRALAADFSLEPYWRSLESYISVDLRTGDAPPQFAFFQRKGDLRSLLRHVEVPSVTFRWNYPLDLDEVATIGSARAVAEGLKGFEKVLRRDRLAEAFHCTDFCFNTSSGPYTSGLGSIVTSVNNRVRATEVPIALVAYTGAFGAAVLLAAAVVFMLGRRESELQLLVARGWGPGGLALKMLVEAALPVAVGIACAPLAIVALARTAGAPDPLAGGLGPQLAQRVALAAVLALVLVTFVGARAATRGSTKGRWSRALPWAAVALTVVLAALLRDDRPAPSEGSGEGLPPLLVAFPLCFAAALGGVHGLGARLASRYAARRLALERPAMYLATHRVAGSGSLAPALVMLCSIGIGLFVFAQAMSASVGASVRAKSLLFVGGETNATATEATSVPASFEVPATKVVRSREAVTTDAGEVVDVLAIDPDTFARAAYWDDGFSDMSLDRILSQLGSGGADAPLPVAVAGLDAPPYGIWVGDEVRPVRTVAMPASLPGQVSDRPMMMVDESHFEAVFEGLADPLTGPGAYPQLWLAASESASRRALAAAGLSTDEILSARRVASTPALAALSSTLSYLGGLGIAMSALAALATAMYLVSRQRQRLVSHALASRMGLTSQSHFGALVIEAGSLFGAGAIAGALAGIGATALLLESVMPLPTIPPAGSMQIPVGVMAVAALAAIGFCIGAGWLVHATARRANVATLMRAA